MSSPSLPALLPFLSVVIPAYNEESRIGPTLEQVLDYLGQQAYSWEVAVADDGSTDATARLVWEMAERRGEGRLRCLSLPHGGKGWAVRQGMLHVQGEYRFMCDADLSMSIDQLERFLPPAVGEYDVAAGSRTAPGAQRIGEPARRRFTAKGFSLLARTLASCGIEDTQCGFKCFRGGGGPESLLAPEAEWLCVSTWSYCSLRASWACILVEVPIEWHHSPESKVRLVRDASLMARDILQVRWDWARGRYGRVAPF